MDQPEGQKAQRQPAWRVLLLACMLLQTTDLGAHARAATVLHFSLDFY